MLREERFGVEEAIMPPIQITGLELLQQQNRGSTATIDSEDYSVESFCNDSVDVALKRAPIPRLMERMRQKQRLQRPRSGSIVSDFAADESWIETGNHYGYGAAAPTPRRSSMDSMANSVASFANDSTQLGRSAAAAPPRPTRRSSLGRDSTFVAKYNMVRRTDSNESIGRFSYHKGYGQAATRRSSLDSRSEHLISTSSSSRKRDSERSRPARRSSIGAMEMLPPVPRFQQQEPKQQQRRRSSLGVESIDSGFEKNLSAGEMKRRPSGSSCCSGFSQELLETQSINSQVSRAA